MSIRAKVMILVATVYTVSLCAQNEIDAPLIHTESRWTGSAYMDWGIASSHFSTNLDHDYGLGVGGEFLYRLQKGGPVWGGLGVHSFIFDRYTLRYSQELDGEIFNYQDRTASRVFMAHGLLRFQPKIRFVIRPYVQGALGVHWFFTNTTIKDTDANEILDRINENRASVIGVAMHAGFHIVPPRFPDFRGDVRIGYFRNASVEYMRYSDELGGPFAIDAFERKESAVDLIGIHVGVAIRIREEY
jgi:hypothetical protein